MSEEVLSTCEKTKHVPKRKCRQGFEKWAECNSLFSKGLLLSKPPLNVLEKAFQSRSCWSHCLAYTLLICSRCLASRMWVKRCISKGTGKPLCLLYPWTDQPFYQKVGQQGEWRKTEVSLHRTTHASDYVFQVASRSWGGKFHNRKHTPNPALTRPVCSPLLEGSVRTVTKKEHILCAPLVKYTIPWWWCK